MIVCSHPCDDTALTAKAGWFTDEIHPTNAKPLSEVIKSVQDQGYKTIESIDFDDDEWEIEFTTSTAKPSCM
jgi:hypothetical protein